MYTTHQEMQNWIRQEIIPAGKHVICDLCDEFSLIALFSIWLKQPNMNYNVCENCLSQAINYGFSYEFSMASHCYTPAELFDITHAPINALAFYVFANKKHVETPFRKQNLLRGNVYVT